MTEKLSGPENTPLPEKQPLTTEAEVMDKRARIQRGIELCQHLSDHNPGLVISYLAHIPRSQENDREAQQIALRVANLFPDAILRNAEHIRGRPWAEEVLELAQQNNTNK